MSESTQEGEAHHGKRLAAIAALVLAAAAVVAAALLAATNLLHLVVLPVAVGGIVIGGWVTLTRRGKARLAGEAVAAVALVGFVAIVLTGDHHGLGMVLVAALAAASVGCARHALGLTQAALRAAPVPGVDVGPATKPVLIMNLRSGGGKAEHFELERLCGERGIEPIVLTPGVDLQDLARDAIERGCDVIGMAGGDGSQALVAQVASAADVPLVCIPAGTRNHFAADLGLDRTDVVGALDAFFDASERRIDLADVNGRVFVNNVSMGVYAHVVQRDEYRDAKAKTVTETLPELLGPDATPLDLRYVDGDGVEHATAHVIQVSNNRYDLNLLGGFGYRPSISDGVLGVATASAGVVGQPVRWAQWDVPTFEVNSSGPVAVGVDGEALTMDPPLRFSVQPGVLRVRLPHHSFGYSPAARRHDSFRSALRDLADAARGRS